MLVSVLFKTAFRQFPFDFTPNPRLQKQKQLLWFSDSQKNVTRVRRAQEEGGNTAAFFF